jgi:glycosyltransferase involved in cell wall biosynthesis
MSRVVLLSPYFPPSPYVMGRRNTKLAKHLVSFGWEPIVVSLPDGGGRGHDPETLARIPPEVLIDRHYTYGLLGTSWWSWEAFKAKRRAIQRPVNPSPTTSQATQNNTIGKKLFKLYETYIGTPTSTWQPVDMMIPYVLGAARRAAELAKEHDAKVIFGSACPYSTLLAGVLAGYLADLPVVLDMRDPWSIETMYFPHKPQPLQRLESWLEALCFERAAHIFLNTERCQASYKEKFPQYADKIDVLPNGFDRSVMQAGEAFSYQGFSLVHFGNCYATRSLLPALKAISQERDVRIVCFGQIQAADLAEARRLGLEDKLEVRPPVSYVDAMRALEGASALLLLQPPDTDLQIPAKFYDYLASSRPIIALSANPEIHEIIRRTNRGVSADIRDEAQVEQALRTIIHGDSQPSQVNQAAVDVYDAAMQAKKVAAVFDRVSRGNPLP